MLLHAFLSIFVSLLHATSWISRKLCLQAANFLSNDVESAKKILHLKNNIFLVL
jgi:hypothetical protein